MAYIEKEKLLAEIDELKKSPWYNDDFGGGLKQARQEGVNIVVDMCIKYAPTVDVTEKRYCENCVHFTKQPSQYPCSHCRNCYTDKFQQNNIHEEERGVE